MAAIIEVSLRERLRNRAQNYASSGKARKRPEKNLITGPAPNPFAMPSFRNFLLSAGVVLTCWACQGERQASGPDLSLLTAPGSRVQIPARAQIAVEALRDRDMQTLSQLTHPQQGLRFTPEVYVEPFQPVFPAAAVAGLLEDATSYTWGVADGSGDTIRGTFAAYYPRYVYDLDFAGADSVYYNEAHQWGNRTNNARQVYPGAVLVEYYFPAVNTAAMGLDWRALRLVFLPYEGDWYLVGVIHAQWTP